MDKRQSSNAKQLDKVATKKGKTKYNQKKAKYKSKSMQKAKLKVQKHIPWGDWRQAETGRNMNISRRGQRHEQTLAETNRIQ